MSNATYNAYLRCSNRRLSEQIKHESIKDPALVPKDWKSTIQHLAGLYVKYIAIFRKMEDAYEHMVHPQKIPVVRELLTALMGRLIEMKHQLSDLEATDSRNFSDELLDLKLCPEDIEIPIPRYFLAERSDAIAELKSTLEVTNAKSLESCSVPAAETPMDVATAVKILQINERGRQGKSRAASMRDIKIQAQREIDFGKNEDKDMVGQAVLTIQRVWKGFRSRRNVAEIRQEEQLFLEMIPPSSVSPAALERVRENPTFRHTSESLQNLNDSTSNELRKAENEARRRILRKQFHEEYLGALVSIKEKLRQIDGPEMKEAIQDDFRQWYIARKAETKFPEFPNDAEFKTIGFRFLNPLQGKEPVIATTDAPVEPKTAPPTGKGKKGGNPSPTEEEMSAVPVETEYTKAVKKSNEAYGTIWANRNESDNFAQRYDAGIIRADKLIEVENEVREEIIEVLKEELKSMQARSAKAGKKGSKEKGKKGKKEKKGKKDKGGAKGKGAKKEKDLTAGRSTDSLLEELIQTGIVQKYEPVRLKEFLGQCSVMEKDGGSSSFIDLKRTITEYCILPLGFDNILDSAPRVGSVLLYGSPGTGKTTLVKSIATETGATLFNITPSNTAKEYVGKANVTKMIHMVFKVAKLKAPSVVYLGNAEMVFAKKVPKDDATDPKRIKKDLQKAIKGLKPSDRVLVIGTSHKPWDADLKTMIPCFEKTIMTPKPDYGSRTLLWNVGIRRRLSVFPSGNAVHPGLLARLSDGITAGGIFHVCDAVLSKRRLRLLKLRPLDNSSFLNYLGSSPHLINHDETMAFKDFSDKLPLAKKRQALLESEEAHDNAPEKKKK